MLRLESTKRVWEYWYSCFARIYIEIYDDNINTCILTHLWVDEDQRQKGYGKQVLAEAEEKAKKLGCSIIFLKVESNSWMHKWYLRSGYLRHSDTLDDYTWLIKYI